MDVGRLGTDQRLELELVEVDLALLRRDLDAGLAAEQDQPDAIAVDAAHIALRGGDLLEDQLPALRQDAVGAVGDKEHAQTVVGFEDARSRQAEHEEQHGERAQYDRRDTPPPAETGKAASRQPIHERQEDKAEEEPLAGEL